MVGLRLSRILSETNDKVEFCLGVYVIFWRGTKQGEGLQLSGNQPPLQHRSAAVATGRVLLALSEQRSVHASRDIREIAVTASTDILEKSGKQNTTTL